MKANPLVIIAVLFATAFAGRALGIANAAAGREEAPAPETTPSAVEAAPPEAMTKAATETVESNKISTTTPASASAPVSSAQRAMQNESLAAAIRQRSDAIDAKEADIEDRIRMLEAIEKRIDEKLVELRDSHEALERLVTFANEASEQDIALLARMYEQMKPQKAGEIFNKMNPAFAAGFLTEMNSENAALILANMTTENAYEASMIIASRNAAVHQQ